MARRPSHQRKPDDFRPGKIGHWPADKPTSELVALRVLYVPNGEHKTYPSPDGSWTISHKIGKAKCWRIARDDWPPIEELLRDAIRAEVVDEEFRGKFPQRVWAFINGCLVEARLSNRGQGQHHGFRWNTPNNFRLILSIG